MRPSSAPHPFCPWYSVYLLSGGIRQFATVAAMGAKGRPAVPSLQPGAASVSCRPILFCTDGSWFDRLYHFKPLDPGTAHIAVHGEFSIPRLYSGWVGLRGRIQNPANNVNKQATP